MTKIFQKMGLMEGDIFATNVMPKEFTSAHEPWKYLQDASFGPEFRIVLTLATYSESTKKKLLKDKDYVPE